MVNFYFCNVSHDSVHLLYLDLLRSKVSIDHFIEICLATKITLVKLQRKFNFTERLFGRVKHVIQFQSKKVTLLPSYFELTVI